MTLPEGRMSIEEYLKSKKYVIVTTTSTHRIRYAIPVTDCHTDDPVEGAMDLVAMDEVDEFSQKHLGEHIVDAVVMDEKGMLKLFDKENEYLKNWSEEKKIQWVRNSVQALP